MDNKHDILTLLRDVAALFPRKMRFCSLRKHLLRIWITRKLIITEVSGRGLRK